MPEIHASNRKRWGVLLPALLFPLAASFFYFVFFPGTLIGNGSYKGIKFFLLIWPIVATAWILREPFRRESPSRSDWIRSVAWGVGFGVAVVAAMVLLMEFTPLGAVVEAGEGKIREKTEQIGMIDHFILFALGLSIAHSALEEFFWRWFVFGNLRRLMSKHGAIVLAAVGFAAHHVVVLNAFFPTGYAWFFGICVGIGGAMWSWIYQRHKTLLGAWISHMIIDFGALGIGYRLMFGT